MIEIEEKCNEIEEFGNAFIKLSMYGFEGMKVTVNDFPEELQVKSVLDFIYSVYMLEESREKKEEMISQINDLLSMLTEEDADFGEKGSALTQ